MRILILAAALCIIGWTAYFIITGSIQHMRDGWAPCFSKEYANRLAASDNNSWDNAVKACEAKGYIRSY